MKIRILVSRDLAYDFIEIDTDNLLVTSVDCSTGRVLLFPASNGSTFSKDSLPTLFLDSIIKDLIDKN